MKKVTALALSLILLALFLTGCTNGAGNDVKEVDTTELPSRFDLRNVDGKNYVTPVKTQKYGDCWTFALAGAAETAYLYANDMSAAAGEKNDQVDFSEKYIAWYMFHGLTGDDVVKGKVRASQAGEGFDPSKAEEETGELTAYYIGGPFVQTANLFGSGFGPVDESVEVNGEFPYAYDDDSSVEWSLPLNAEYRSAPATALFRELRILPSPADTDADGDYRFNRDGIDAIRKEVYQGHGVCVALNAADAGYNGKNRTSYYSGYDEPNHAVVVVGYDDDFPKEKFTRTKSNGEEIEDSTPPDNGALILKNSWGLTSFDGDIDDGYVYLSYYDHSLLAALSFVFDNNKNAKHPVRNYDQYDLMMTMWYGTTDYEDETKMANVFEAEEDETLCQIEYRTSRPDADVSYEIYTGAEKDDPSSGKLLEQGVHSHRYAGSHVIDLNREYPLKKGECYSIVLTMKHGDSYTEVFPYGTQINTDVVKRLDAIGIVNQGESYLFADGRWSDMTEMKDSLLDRAYRQCAENIASDKAVPDIELDQKTFAVDNYPIKAILAPDGQ
ncbi:MAG: hypothetical protein IJG87_06090 [Ruminococcus sp.]|nr:hypothetical protein [Ruminococcus sp.]